MNRSSYQPLISALLILSCTSRSDESDHSFQQYTEYGIHIAETSGGPKYDGEIFSFREECTIKDDDDNPESILYRPGDGAVGPGGEIFIADEGNRRIAAFDPDGSYRSSFGREGNGPGEFQALRILRVDADGIVAFDYMLSRTTVFRPDGSLAQTLSASDDPNLAWHSLDGEIARILRLDFRREPVTDTDQANHHAWWQARIRREEVERVRQFYREYEKHETFPKDKSLWGWITVDDAGFIWMQDHFDYSGSADVPGATTYRVLSPEGEYLGTAEWPAQRGFIQNGHFLSRIEDGENGSISWYSRRRRVTHADRELITTRSLGTTFPEDDHGVEGRGGNGHLARLHSLHRGQLHPPGPGRDAARGSTRSGHAPPAGFSGRG